MRRIFIHKRWIFIALSLTGIFCYGAIFQGYLSYGNHFEKNHHQALYSLHEKIDLISRNIKLNRSFLTKLHHQFESVIDKEKLRKNITNMPLLPGELLHQNKKVTIPVIVFAYNRPSVSRCLDLLLKYKASLFVDFPIIVSQDGNHQETTNVIESYGQQILHYKHPEPIGGLNVPQKHKKLIGYYKIALHYKWALSKAFHDFSSAQTVIILEDDLEIATDFFSYFEALYDLFITDKSLYCISAWNDNGKFGLIDEDGWDTLYRSDFFPGLGWMLKRSTWLEWHEKWPDAFWDDWVREPVQRKNRSCVRPEISRTKTFGKIGVSNGQFYEQHLKYIKLNTIGVNWTLVDLSYLQQKNYDSWFVEKVYKLPLVTIEELRSSFRFSQDRLRIEYHNSASFKATAKFFGLMEDFKAGVARTAYHGIVSTMHHNQRFYVAPKLPWNGYDSSWR